MTLVRLLKPYQFRKVGSIMDVPPGSAEMLVQWGTCERVDQADSREPEPLVPPPPAKPMRRRGQPVAV